MHCPNCGTFLEADNLSFCTRCGQQLDRIRAAMSDTEIEVRNIEISHASLNFGVGLMYLGVWPALLAVISSPVAIPAALLMIIAIWFVILLGSGPLLRLFQHTEMPKEVERTRRREIAFGSTLMLIGTILATMLVAVLVPDRWVPIGLVTALTGVFVLLLALSKTLFQGHRNLASNEPQQLDEPGQQALTTGALDNAVAELPPADARSYNNAFAPSSVTDSTTRHLDPTLTKHD
jgi:MFS family permease